MLTYTNSQIMEAAKQAESALRAIPLPPGSDTSRAIHTRHRLAMLLGTWLQLASDHLEMQLGSKRAQMQAPPSIAHNPFQQVCSEIAVLYDSPPTILQKQKNVTRDDYAPLLDIIHNAGYWAQAQEVQRFTVGLRECFVAIDIEPESGNLIFRTVTPDMVRAVAGVRPDQPVRVEELRRVSKRDIPEQAYRVAEKVQDTTGDAWLVFVYDISDPSNPHHSVALYSGSTYVGEDITREYYALKGVGEASYSGQSYPYKFTSGKPFLPYVLYHAKRNGVGLFDPYHQIELVLGTLDVATLYSFLMHISRDASWPQRAMVNGYVPMTDVAKAVTDSNTEGVVQQITPDPTLILQVLQVPDTTGQVTIGQWSPGGDMEKFENVITNLTVALAQSAGVSPSDVQRLGGTARSGAAISLTNAGKREQQRRLAPIFADPDGRLIAYAAAIHNRWADSDATRQGYQRFPESGYEVIYKKIPRSPEELKAHREHVEKLMELGLMNKVEAYAELFDTTLEAAKFAIEQSESMATTNRASVGNENAIDTLEEALSEAQGMAGAEDSPEAETSKAIQELIQIAIGQLKTAIEARVAQNALR